MKASDALGLVKVYTEDHCPQWLIDRIAKEAAMGHTEVHFNDFFDKLSLSDMEIGWLEVRGYKVKRQDQQWVDFEEGRQGFGTCYTVSWL